MQRRIWLALCLSMAAACSQLVDFDRSKIPNGGDGVGPDGSIGTIDGGGGGGKDAGMDGGGPGKDAGLDAGHDASTPCDVATHAGCEPDELCCSRGSGPECVPTSATTECEACGIACDAATAGTCANRTCECVAGSGAACDATSSEPFCASGACVECTEDADCDGNPNGEQCVGGECVECDPADNTCSGTTPICNAGTNSCESCSDAPNNCPNGLECNPSLGCLGCDPADDSGCGTGTPQCDPSTTQCVQCLGNGDCSGRTPVCTANSCGQCTTNAECNAISAGSVCVESGTEDGRCATCDPTDDNGCMGGTPQCLQDGTTFTCVECLTNTDCSGTEPICNTGTHQCEPCDTNAECSAKTPGTFCVESGSQDGACATCDPSDDDGCTSNAAPQCLQSGTSFSCVECVASNLTQCTAAEPICRSNACGACLNDGECAAYPNTTCREGTGRCVECTDNTQCADEATDRTCDTSTNICVQCLTDAQCSGTTPICNTSTNTCQACTAFGGNADSECADRSASTPACLPSGACAACETSADCTDPDAPICNGSNQCVACTTDGQCSAKTSGTVCATSGTNAGRCGACDPADSAECSGNTPICNATSLACIACTAVGTNSANNTACDAKTDGTFCVSTGASSGSCRACDPDDDDGCSGTNDQCSATFTCVDCVSGDGCGANQVCVTGGNSCVACNGASDCADTPTTPYCVSNECVACRNNSDCTTGNLACVSGTCQACANDTQCTGHPTGTQCVDIDTGAGTDFECRACDPLSTGDTADDVGCGMSEACNETTFVCQ